MLLALMAVPFASNAQGTDDPMAVNRLSVGNFDGYTGGTTQYADYNQLVGTATPSWTYATQTVYGVEANHYYNTLYQGGRYQWLVTPAIDLMDLADAQLTYSVALTATGHAGAPDSIGADKKFMVLASTDGLTWTPIRTYTGDDLAAIPATWDVDTIDLENFRDQYETVYFAFYTESVQPRTGNATLHVGNIGIDGHLKCLAVSNLAASMVTPNSITITWTNDNPLKYGHRVIVMKGEEQIDSADLPSSARAYTVNNLDPATIYTFYVRVSCTGNEWLEAAPLNVFTHYNVDITLPYTNDFEAENALTGWTIVNDTHALTNGWYIGNDVASTVKTDSYSLGSALDSVIFDTAWNDVEDHSLGYDADASTWEVTVYDTNWVYDTTWNKVIWISDDGGLTNHYTRHSSSVTYHSYAYMTLGLEAGDYNLGFDWRCKGESANWESIRIFLADEQDAPVAGMTGTSNWREITATGLYGKDTWQNYYKTFNVAETGNYHLVFYWKNDGVNNQPPAAIDNLLFNKVICYPVSDVAVVDSLTTGTSLTVSFTGLEDFDGTYRGVAKAGDVTVTATANADDNTMTFTGLKGETTYAITLYTVCGEDNESNPTEAINGTTLPTCYAVENLEVVADSTTANRLVIAWDDANNTDATYLVRVMKGSDTVAVTETQSTSFSIDTLVSSTTYTFYVRTVCAEGDSARLTRSVSGQTACGVITLPYTQNFNDLTVASSIPVCWDNSEGTTTTASYKWCYNSKTSGNGNPNNGHEGKCVVFDSYMNSTNNTNTLATPEIEITNATKLSFWYKNPSAAGGFTVKVGIVGESERTTLATGLIGASSWTEKVIELDAATYAGHNIKLYFEGKSNYGSGDDYIYLDDVTLTPITCGAPIVALVDRTGNTVDISWECDFHADDVTYLVANVGVDTTAVTGVLAYQLANLAAETDLTIKVAMVCDYGDTLWSDALATRTLGACNAPEDLVVSNVARASFDLSWTQAVSNVTNYDLIISDTAVVDFDAWTPIFVEGATSYTATGLDRETTFYVYLRANCGAATSAWQSTTVTTKGLVDCTIAGTPVTVANGTVTNNYVLLRASYQDEPYHSQVIYPADMLTNFVGKTIKSMTFYTTYASTISYSGTDWSVSTMKFYLNEVNESTLSARNSNTGTVVYEGTTTYNSSDKTLTYVFDTPFTYTGTGNLMLTLDYTNANSGYTSGGFYGISTDGNTAWCQYSSYTKTFLPKVTFGMCGVGEACPNITALEADDIDVNTATLNWTASEADYLDGYQMIVSDTVVTDFDAWTPTPVAASATSYDLTGLTQATNYYVYMRSLCARDHDTSAWAETTFLTMEACRAATDLAAERVTRNSAHVSWVNGGAELGQPDDFTLVWSTDSEENLNTAEHTIAVSDATETTVAGLPYSSTVYFWVKHNCTDMSLSSAWLGPVSVTTNVAMPEVINLTAEVTHGTALVTWEKDSLNFAPESEWKISIMPAASEETPVYTLIDHMDTLFIGLQNETAYTVRVIAVYNDEESDTAEYTFTTNALPSACAQIGTGTTGSSSLPYAGWYHNSYTQQLFTAEEIGNEGTITSISFQYTKASAESRNITIFMGTTDETSLSSSWISPSNMTEVFHAAQVTFSNDNDWFNIALDEPFEYTGGNILVAMYMNYNSSETGYGNGNRFYVNSATGKARTATNDGTQSNYFTLENGVITNANGSSSSSRNNIQFCFMRESSCLQPTQVVASDVTTNSATISWMPGNTETAWQYTYGLTEEEAMAATPVDVTSMNVNLTDLMGDKDYHFYVRGICGDAEGDTSAWAHNLFATGISCDQPAGLLYANRTSNSITLIAMTDETGTPESVTFSYWPDTNTLQAVEVTAQQVIMYDTTFTTEGEVDHIETITNRYEANLTGLTPATKYNFKARTNCVASEGSSRWTNTYYVTTACDGTVTIPYTEDFASTSLNKDCWTVVVNDAPISNGGDIIEAGIYNEKLSFSMGKYTSSGNFQEFNRYFISPSFVADDTLKLSFTYMTHGSNIVDMYWGYSTSETGNDSADFVWTLIEPNTATATNYTAYIPATAKRVAFGLFDEDGDGYNMDGGRYSIDDVKVETVIRRNLTVASNDAAMGTLTVLMNGDTVADSVATFTKTVFDGASVKLIANNADHYHIVNWTNGITGDTIWNNYNTRSFTLNADTNLVANFEIDPYTLTVYNTPANLGAAWVKDSVVDGVTFYDKDTAFNYGTEITVHALDTVTNDTYHFRGWSTSSMATNMEAYVSFSADYTFVPEATMTLYAHFVIDSVAITANLNDENGGVVTGQGQAALNSTVHMTAEPNYGYHFVNWTGENDFATTELSFDTVATVAATFTANFAKDPFYMLVGVNDENLGTATATPDFGLYNDVITLSATATAAHYHFERWTDGDTNNPREFHITQDTIMTAFFSIDQHTLQLAAREDMGTVKINGEDTNAITVDYGTNVVIEAVPNTGVAFSNWSDNVMGAQRTVNVVSDSNLTAMFDSILYNIVVAYDDNMGTVYEGTDTTATGNVVAAGDTLHTLYNGEITLTWTSMHGVAGSYKLANWTFSNNTNTPNDTTITFTVTEDMTVNANFIESGKSMVTVQSANNVMGTVSGNGQYNALTEVNIAATPAEHYHFVNWVMNPTTDSTIITTAEYGFTAQEDVNVTFIAYFAIDTVDFQFASNDVEMGAVTAVPATAGYYDYGTQVTLTATANTDEHFHFVNWNDGTNTAEYTFTLTADTNLVANFAIDTVTLTVVANDTMRGTVTGSGDYPYGTVVNLEAQPAEGYFFQNWSTGATTTTTIFEVRVPTTVTANFDTNEYEVTLVAENGTIEGPATAKHFTTVTYVATADYGYHFVNWTNNASENDTLNVDIVSDTTVTANFAKNNYTVTAAANNDDFGTVTGTTTVPYLTNVTLVATAAEGYHLVGWSNGMTTDTIEVVADSNKTLTANFAINVYNVTATANVAERGTVTGAHPTAHGSVDTLVAVANYGYVFEGWNNGVTTDTLFLTVTEETSVIANFGKAQFTATALSADVTMGTVTVSSPTADYLDVVSFKATANEGYHFDHWSNGLTEDSVAITLTKDTALTAYFALNTYTVNVSSASATMGTVAPAGDSIVNHGTSFTATATANNGYHFVAWISGTDTVSTVASYTFTVNANTAIVAHFARTYYSVTVMSASATMGTVSGSDSHVGAGDSVTATATAANGYRFTGWMSNNNIVSTENPYTFEVTSDITLVAQFVAVYTVTAQANDNTMGTVTPTTATYDEGEEATVTATANEGYHFVAWVNANNTNDTINRNAQYTFTVSANVDLIAVFKANNNGIDDVDMDNVTIYSTDSKIIVRGAENRSVYVFDVNGRQVVRETNATETVEFRMATTGVYLVKVGNAPAKRVVVIR